MEEKVNYALVGVFVLVLGAGLIGGVLWLSSGKSYNTQYDIYQTYTRESVAGLNLNAPVRYLGVDVGRVNKIALAPNNVEEVQITLAIARGTPVRVDTLAALKTQGLTGLAFVELSGSSRDSPALQAQNNEEYPVITSGPSLLTRLDSGITSLIANLNRSSKNINALLDKDNRRAFKHSLANIETLSHTLAAHSTMIDSSLRDAARTMKNTARLSDELPQLVQRIQHSADAFDHMSSELSRAGTNASVAFTDGTLPEVHQLVVELRDLTSSLRRVSGELEQNPSVLLYGKPAPKRGPGE